MDKIQRFDEESRMEANEILDTSSAIEKQEGVITVFTIIEHPPCSDKYFDILFPDTDDYVVALEIASDLRRQGTPVGAVDILIAAMCINRGAKLVSLDKDFEKIQRVCPDLRIRYSKLR